jgi:phage recombination protein Bet
LESQPNDRNEPAARSGDRQRSHRSAPGDLTRKGKKMNAPIIRQSASVPALAMNENELITVLENSLYPGAGSTSIALVINYCRAAGLDPMQKPVHIVPIWDSKAGKMRDVVMPGIGLYRTQAARSGGYAGVTEPEYGPDVTEKLGGQEITFPAWCKVTVKRRLPTGDIVEFTATERWKENYAVKGGKEKSIAPNSMWTRRPFAQIAKCAEAQALRKAFPEFGAAATAEEMEGRAMDDYQGATIDGSTVEVVRQKTLPDYLAADFANNLPKWQALIAEGKKSAEQIIATVSSKAILSEEQKAQIRAVQSSSAVTFAQVAEKLNRADCMDVLDLAADLIGDVSDPAQRVELSALYQSNRSKFL